MLGQDLVAALGESPGAHEVTAVDRDVLDIIDPDACLAFVAGHDFVVNVAAWTAVDDAETHEAQAFAVNAVGAYAPAPTTSDAFVRPAPRPAYSVLGHDAWQRAGLPGLPDWRQALAEALPSVVPRS